jgi:hypothetical protein
MFTSDGFATRRSIAPTLVELRRIGGSARLRSRALARRSLYPNPGGAERRSAARAPEIRLTVGWPMMRRLITAGVIAVAQLACYSGAARSRAPLTSRNYVSAAEMAAQPTGSLYEALQRLRPEFLRSRGVTTFAGGVIEEGLPIVYCDHMRLGGLEWLRNIPASDVVEVRFLSAGEAQFRYGNGHQGGVIDIVTKH